MDLIEDTVTGELFDPAELPIVVTSSMAGYYVGQLEPCGAPYSRLSDYYKRREDAEKALKEGWGLRENLENDAVIEGLEKSGKIKTSSLH